MAWPVDAIYQTFVAWTRIRSAFLNQIQERIVDVIGGRKTLKKLEVDGVGDQAPGAAPGDIVASGTIAAGADVTAAFDMTAGGNVTSTAGDVSAQVNVTATTGKVSALVGDVEGEHLVGLGGTPGAVVGVGAGAGAVLTIGGVDSRHVLNLTSGAAPLATPWALGTITFAKSYVNPPTVVMTPVVGTNALGVAEVSLIGAGPYTGYTWSTPVAPMPAQAYVWRVAVIG